MATDESLATGSGPSATIGFENLFNGIGQVYVESGYEFLALGASELNVPIDPNDRRLGTQSISPNGTADGVRMRRLDGEPFDLISLNALMRFPADPYDSIYLASIRTDSAFVEATIPRCRASRRRLQAHRFLR